MNKAGAETTGAPFFSVSSKSNTHTRRAPAGSGVTAGRPGLASLPIAGATWFDMANCCCVGAGVAAGCARGDGGGGFGDGDDVVHSGHTAKACVGGPLNGGGAGTPCATPHSSASAAHSARSMMPGAAPRSGASGPKRGRTRGGASVRQSRCSKLEADERLVLSSVTQRGARRPHRSALSNGPSRRPTGAAAAPRLPRPTSAPLGHPPLGCRPTPIH